MRSRSSNAGDTNQPAALGMGVLDRHIGQQVELGVAISCRLVQDDGHSSQEQDLTRVVGGSERLLEDPAGFHPSPILPLSH